MSGTLLEVRNLSVSFESRGVKQTAVNNLSFSLQSGEILGIVGESGSGKSVSCYSLLGLIPSPPGRVESGEALFEGVDLLSCTAKQLRALRGNRIAMVFQDPMTSLNPFLTVGEQLLEPLLKRTSKHTSFSRKQARARALQLLEEVGISNPSENISRYPFEFSGGMRQRVMIAMALISEPQLLIADEPTTALDVTIQAQVLELLAELQRKRNIGVIFISHDLAVVRKLAHRVVVMQKGEMVEEGNCEELFASPSHPYTKALLDAVPKGAKAQASLAEDSLLLDVQNLSAGYRVREANGIQLKTVVDDVSFQIQRSEIVGLVGESGSGKSTIGRSVLQLLKPSAGKVIFDGEPIHDLSTRQMRPFRTRMQMIFQDPYASLNPRMTVFDALAEPLLFHAIAKKSDLNAKVSELMQEVGLEPSLARKYPHEFSGGQRQRIAIGRALASRPELIVADEPVSALDVTIQAQILELLISLVKKYRMSMLFISHDLSVVRVLCDKVLVIRHGRLVEQAATEHLWANPQHEYTRTLLSSAPVSAIDL
ncbi:MAG: ABC transporter ATP-binding protein [Pseudomonadales bacterium]